MAEERTVQTVVVGAGQAGLAVGYHLTRHGHEVVLLDAAEAVGDSWRARWDSLRLFTPPASTRCPACLSPAGARTTRPRTPWPPSWPATPSTSPYRFSSAPGCRRCTARGRSTW